MCFVLHPYNCNIFHSLIGIYWRLQFCSICMYCEVFKGGFPLSLVGARLLCKSWDFARVWEQGGGVGQMWPQCPKGTHPLGHYLLVCAYEIKRVLSAKDYPCNSLQSIVINIKDMEKSNDQKWCFIKFHPFWFKSYCPTNATFKFSLNWSSGIIMVMCNSTLGLFWWNHIDGQHAWSHIIVKVRLGW